MSGRIRALALCVFRRGNRILVHDDQDQVTGGRFCRPLGGGIEFMETGAAAMVREIREELGVAVTRPRFIGVLESLFVHNGAPGHEIVMVYDAEFVDPSLYKCESIPGNESNGYAFRARWFDLGSPEEQLPLYPKGLGQLLAADRVPDVPGEGAGSAT